MKKLIKRKDGSYSKRGLWDNIRANKGSGKEPTKQMLKQESKIKKEENMNSMYKKGGKASKKPMKKESFMEESKELHFGAPGVKPPMKKKMMGGKYEMGGGPGDGTTTKKNLFGRTITETTGNSGLDYDRTVTRRDGSVAKKSGVKSEAFSYNPETQEGNSDRDNRYKIKYDRSGNVKSSEYSTEKYIQEDKNSKGEYDRNSIPFTSSIKINKRGKVVERNGVRQMNDNPDRTTLEAPGSGSTERLELKEKARKSRASFKTGGSMFETMLDKLKVKGKKK